MSPRGRTWCAGVVRALTLLVLVGCGGPEVYSYCHCTDASLVDAFELCNPKTQTGCQQGQKCTWIHDQANPPIGHIGCVPDGSLLPGAACEPPVAGPSGYDRCAAGTLCLDGTCATICEAELASSTCAGSDVCSTRDDLLTVGGTAVAGLCVPRCDALTQRVGDVEACGSPDPTAPTRGCYGYEQTVCLDVAGGALTQTDRTPPVTDASSNPLVHGCAPGFMPMFVEQTGSTKVMCGGLCAALDIDGAHAANARGDAAALGKLPADPVPVAGHATCDVGIKGSEATSQCRYLWPFLEPPRVPVTIDLDRVGVCLAYDRFRYDANGDGSVDTAYPDCTTLPPRSAATPGAFDDAYDWGCQKRVEGQRATAYQTIIGFPDARP